MKSWTMIDESIEKSSSHQKVFDHFWRKKLRKETKQIADQTVISHSIKGKNTTVEFQYIWLHIEFYCRNVEIVD